MYKGIHSFISYQIVAWWKVNQIFLKVYSTMCVWDCMNNWQPLYISFSMWVKDKEINLSGFLLWFLMPFVNICPLLSRVYIFVQVKVLTNPGSNVPLATPVAISTTLPPLVSALNQQGSSALSAPSSHRTNTSTTSPAPSSASDSTAIQLFLRQLSAYVKGTCPFYTLRLLPFSCPAWMAAVFSELCGVWKRLSSTGQFPS